MRPRVLTAGFLTLLFLLTACNQISGVSNELDNDETSENVIGADETPVSAEVLHTPTEDLSVPAESSPADGENAASGDANAAEVEFAQSDADGGDYPWDNKTTFTVENHTNGEHPDEEIYWAIVGRDPASGNFVHIEADGSAQEASLADNGALSKDGVGYSNYFHNLEDLDTVTIGLIDSARLFMSVGSPMYLQINTDANGAIAYAGANVQNPNDPNHDIYFDVIEMAIVKELGIFVNTTRVDHFGFPVRLRLEGQGGYDKTVGETESRQEIVDAFVDEVPTEFKGLYETPSAPYRIVAPAHSTFSETGEHGDYLDEYIDEVWEKYRNEDLTFTIQTGTYTGRVVGDTFTFTDEETGTGVYKINGKPTTQMVMLGNIVLNDAEGAAGPSAVPVQLQIQAQMAAALNRRVAHSPENWTNHDAYFPEGLRSNSYAAFWHRHSIENKAYSFSYSDVADHSPSLHSTSPTKVTIEVGW